MAGATQAARLQRQGGDLDSALRTLGQLVLIAPDDPDVLSEYGKTLVAKGQPADALSFLKRAIDLQPEDWSLYSAQGVAYDQQGDYAHAQVSFAKALSLKPGEPVVLNNSAMSHLQIGDIAGAEALLQQAAGIPSNQAKIAGNTHLVAALRDLNVSTNIAAVARAEAALTAAQAPVPLASTTAELPAAVTVAPAQEVKVSEAPSPKAKQSRGATKAISTPARSTARNVGDTIFVQAGAYGTAAVAGRVAQSLARLGARVPPTVANYQTLFRVRIGPFHNSTEADTVLASAQAAAQRDVKIVRE